MPVVHPISPTSSAIDEIAKLVWEFAIKENKCPVIVTSTSGPAIGLRQALERNRPENLPTQLAFLPKIQGFNQWLLETPELLDLEPPKSDIERWATIYEALENWKGIRERLGAISEGGRWALAKAVVAACDKLSESSLAPDFFNESSSERFVELFEEALADVYPELVRSIVTEDGRLVMAFWKYLSSIADPIPRKQISLSLRAKNATQPLVWIETAQATRAESLVLQNFFSSYEKNYPILKIELDWSEVALWPEALVSLDQVGNDQVIERAVQSKSNKEQVQKNRDKAAKESWRVLGVKNFEDVAWLTALKIREHIEAGRNNIGLIAQDRLVARRVRALLARFGADISVHDGTGWKLSTTGAAAAIHSWLDIVRSPFGPTVHQLLGFLKNPMIDWLGIGGLGSTHAEGNGFDVSAFIWNIEQRLHRKQVSGGWQDISRVFFIDSTYEDDEAEDLRASLSDAYAFIQFLRSRADAWNGAERSGCDWFRLLQDDLVVLSMIDRLNKDLAGQQLLHALTAIESLANERFKLGAWISLVDLCLENSTYVEDAPTGEANVHMLTLSAIRMREFDAVLMVGCDDAHLPSFSDSGLFFSNQLLIHLGMRTLQEEYIQQSRDLSQLLTTHEHVDFIWQQIGQSDAENKPAAWLVRLSSDVKGLMCNDVSFPSAEVAAISMGQAFTAWREDKQYLPAKISPSAYKTLRECPYRFYVTRILGLRQTINVQDGDANLIGKLLHAVLKVFYHDLKSRDQRIDPVVPEDGETRRFWMIKRLTELSAKSFAALIERHAKYLSYANDWSAQIEGFVDWQIDRELSGWQFQDAEKLVGFDLELSGGHVLRIEGVADRFDIANDRAMVMDYKYQSGTKIKSRAKHIDDDPQLLIYAKATTKTNVVEGKAIDAAAWVALKVDEKKPKEREYSVDAFEDLLSNLEEQMKEDLSLVWEGSNLKAQAPEEVCQYCEARGICRKGMWTV